MHVMLETELTSHILDKHPTTETYAQPSVPSELSTWVRQIPQPPKELGESKPVCLTEKKCHTTV